MNKCGIFGSGIFGIGVLMSDVKPRLDHSKLCPLLLARCPEDEELQEMSQTGDFSEFDFDDFIIRNQYPYNDLADLFSTLDETDLLDAFDIGDDEALCLSPTFLWERRGNEPQTQDEAEALFVQTIQKLTDMTEAEIGQLIDWDFSATVSE